MLCLTQKPGDSVNVGICTVKILSVRGQTVRLGFVAPREVPIVRDGAINREARVDLLPGPMQAEHVTTEE